MVDEALLMRKLSELEEYLGQVREYENVTVEEYKKDWKTQRIVERTLQIMIETCVDIAAHVISDKGCRVPKTYADSFEILYEQGILNEALRKTMENMSKFRNVVVHDYEKVDAAIVVGILKNHLDDFLQYRDAIVSWLKEMRKTQEHKH